MRSHECRPYYPISRSNFSHVPLFASVDKPLQLDVSLHKSSLEVNIQPRFVMLDSMLQFANESWSVLVTQVSSSSALGQTRLDGEKTGFYASYQAVCTSRRAQESICSGSKTEFVFGFERDRFSALLPQVLLSISPRLFLSGALCVAQCHSRQNRPSVSQLTSSP